MYDKLKSRLYTNNISKIDISLKNVSKINILFFWLTNLAYLPGIIYSKNKIDAIAGFFVITASILYHTTQIYMLKSSKCCNNILYPNICINCQIIDMIISIIASFVIIINNYHKMNISILLLILLSIIIFMFTFIHNKGIIYIIIHSIWHLLSAFTFYYFSSDDFIYLYKPI